MVESRLQSKSHISKRKQKHTYQSITRAINTLPLFRYSRVADMRLRLAEEMWSRGG
jgi:hypothetical protein